MTQPTQAQIEAALVRLCDALLRQGTEQDGNWGWPTFHKEVKEIKTALTAAQAGESETKYVWARPSDKEKEWQAAIIERCAQVAETLVFDEYGKNRQEIAAAIRKLKLAEHEMTGTGGKPE